jgi:DNA sulfur modification protein DndE
MINKLYTSKQTQEIFAALGQTVGLQPFALSKLAIALSINEGDLSSEEYSTDNEGLELNRQTIFGEYDLLFKCLVINRARRQVMDDEYFPKMIKAHLDRGALLLNNEKRYSKDFFNHLCSLEKAI